MREREHEVSTTLNPELYRKFLAVKECVGVKWNANVLRMIVARAYRKLILEGELF